jgi:hypothetical protein
MDFWGNPLFAAHFDALIECRKSIYDKLGF